MLLATLPAPLSPLPLATADAVNLEQVSPVTDTDDRWGINHTYADPVSQRLAREAGSRWNRWEFRWAEIELSRGRFQWTAYDRMIAHGLDLGPYTRLAEHFRARIERTAAPPAPQPATFADGVADMTVLDAMRRSAGERRTVTIS